MESLQTLALTYEMMVILVLLALAVMLFVSEVVRIDVAAVLTLSILGLLTIVPGLEGIIDTRDLFRGFGSNAVISIIAIMIIGAGLDRTGVVSRIANFILHNGGSTEQRMVPMLSATVATISGFMQNVGAAALFLPVVSRLSARTGVPISRLLMPMGFCAILGGTLTMVGSSPLILLNDLISTSNISLPVAQQMRSFDLFDVTPIGICLVIAGILYFVVLGRLVLPDAGTEGTEATATIDYLEQTYGLDYKLYEFQVLPNAAPEGITVRDIEYEYAVNIVGAYSSGDYRLEPEGYFEIKSGMTLAMLVNPRELSRITESGHFLLKPEVTDFAEILLPQYAGVCEIVIPPNSRLIEQTLPEIDMRRRYGLAVMAIHRGSETLRKDVRSLPLQSGDTLVCHTTWRNLQKIEKDRNFVLITTEYPHEEHRSDKIKPAMLCFGIALTLVLFSDLRLSAALLVGAMGMIITGVLTMDEAYEAVSWKTVFLLASLIPLGQAVETTGTATWIAQQILGILGDAPVWVLQSAVALLATLFTLVMSNVGATVLLVPLSVSIAIGAGANPAVFALTVAIATSNSFLIPTHQVNALIMGPAGYSVRDFIKAGGIMTLLFLLVSLPAINFLVG